MKNVLILDGVLVWIEEKMNSFVLCKVKFDEINLYIIIGVEFLFLCVFIVMIFYFYFNRIMDIDID